MTLGEKLKNYRKKKGLTARAVMDITGIKISTLSNYERDARLPDINVLTKLAKLYGVSLNAFLSEETESDAILVPVLGIIRAGEPICAEQNITRWEKYDDYRMGEEYFALDVKGDSMNERGICDGSTIIVKKQNYINNKEIAVVLVNNEEATVKMVFENENEITLIPCSTNPVHQPKVYNKKDNQIQILGRVMESKIKF